MCSLLTITRTTTIQNVLHKRFKSSHLQNVLHKRFTSSHLQNIVEIITFYGIKNTF